MYASILCNYFMQLQVYQRYLFLKINGHNWNRYDILCKSYIFFFILNYKIDYYL